MNGQRLLVLVVGCAMIMEELSGKIGWAAFECVSYPTWGLDC